MSDQREEQRGREGVSMRWANIGLALLLWAFSAWVIQHSIGFSDPRTGQLPIVLAIFFIIAGAILILLNAIPKTGRPMEDTKPFASIPWPRWIAVAGFLVLFGVGTVMIGFYESAFLFMLAVSLVMSAERENRLRTVGACLLFSVVATAGLWLGFSVLLGIPIPDGILI